MHIHEAVRMAMEKDSLIVRSSAKIEESARYAAIKPTNTYDTCVLVIMADGKTKEACRCWNPTADDLMADDWTVLRNEFGNEVDNTE